MNYSRFPVFLVLALLLLTTGCTSFKKTALMQDAEKYKATATDSTSQTLDLSKLRIQPYDVLNVSIADASKLIINITEDASGTSLSKPLVRTLDKEGKAQLPFIGEVVLLNLTILEAENKLKEAFRKYMKDPYVEVNYAYFKINVMGEVTVPGLKTVPTESASLLDVISMAGGIKETGDVREIKVERGQKVGEQPVVFFIDLTKTDAFNQPGFYLMPNDLVYVKPLKRKFIISNAAGIAAVSAVLNVTVSLLNAYINFNRYNPR